MIAAVAVESLPPRNGLAPMAPTVAAATAVLPILPKNARRSETCSSPEAACDDSTTLSFIFILQGGSVFVFAKEIMLNGRKLQQKNGCPLFFFYTYSASTGAVETAPIEC